MFSQTDNALDMFPQTDEIKKRAMDSAAFGDEFLNDPMHQTRWNSFLKMESGNNVICDARRVFNQIHIL